MNEEERFAVSIFVEIMGILAIAIGVGVEVGLGAGLGTLAIIVGSLLVAAGSLFYFKVFRHSDAHD